MNNLRIRHLLPIVLAIAVLADRPASAAGAVAKPGTLYVLTVGVNGCEKRPAGKLRFADKDARDMGDLLKGQEGKLFNRVVVKTLTNADATRARVRKELRDLEMSAMPGDMIVVFLSGHGGRSLLHGLEFETYDAGNPDGSLTLADLRAPLATVAKLNVPVVLFVDACHAGAVDLSKFGVVVFASSQADQPSLELPARSNGLFTVALTEGLRGKADRNKDGTITLEELAYYLEVRMVELTEEYNRLPPVTSFKQKPRLHRAPSTSPQLGLGVVPRGSEARALAR